MIQVFSTTLFLITYIPSFAKI